MMRYRSVDRLEETLAEQISGSRGSPFISHSDVPSRLEEAALAELAEHVRGTLPRFLQLMAEFPCVCTRVIATALAESYGSHGAQVYGLIAGRLRVGSTIPLHHRQTLHDRFRRSCNAVGLALPSGGRMVDAYLFQAGISQHQLPMLAYAFLRAERLWGLPYIDDTKEVDEWEDRAVGLAPPGLSVLRRIVREDPTGYHATTFVRLRRPETSPISHFERVFRDAIQSPATPGSGDGKPVEVDPNLEFYDGNLWVAIPQRADRLELRIRGRVRPLSRGRRLALPLPWPSAIEWRRSSIGDHGWRRFPLFTSQRSLLVFDGDTERYAGALDPAVSDGQRVRAGQLCFLSRIFFTVNDEPAHCLGRRAFVVFCDISTEMVIEQGDLQCNVGVEPRLRLEVLGERIARNQNGWLLGGRISTRIHGRGSDSLGTLEVRVAHPALDSELHYTVEGTSDDKMAAQLGMPVAGQFGLARASLHIRGQNRALYRTTFWYWPGLERLHDERVFIANSIPGNLAEEKLSHIREDHHGRLVLLEGGAYLRARLCFWVGRRLATFSLPPPGVSMSVRNADGAERPLRVGTSIAVRDDYASSLIVRYSDPKAAIDMRGQIIRDAFGKTGTWQVSLATLGQEGRHNRIRLLFGDELHYDQNLLQVVPEAEPSYFRVYCHEGLWFHDMGFERPISAVRIEAENLVLGERLETLLAVAYPPEPMNHSKLAMVLESTDANRLRIGIDQNEHSDGVWFVSLQVREDGREEWLPVVNASGESFATCIAPEAYRRQLASEDTSSWCRQGHRPDAFLRLSHVVETRIARPCLQSVVDLALDAWKRLGESLDIRDPSDRAGLLKACALSPSPHARESWLPVHHPVEVNPHLFAVPAEEIAELASSELSGYEEFESIGLAGITESLQDAVDVLDVSTTFLIAFERASALQKDPSAPPGAFDFSHYCRFAREMKDLDDKPLSVWHHDRACERMADRVAIVSQDSFSSSRLSKAMTIVHRFAVHQTGEATMDLPHDLERGFPLVQGTPRLLAALTRAWRYGGTEAFWHDLQSSVGLPMEKVRMHVGTILRLAPELLAFYLLLWVLAERHTTD